MKKIRTLTVFVGMHSLVCAQIAKDNFSLVGVIKNYSGKAVYLSYMSIDNKMVRDTAIITQTRFFFSGAIEGPQKAEISVRDKSLMRSYSYEAWIEPQKMKMKIADDQLSSVEITGSKTDKEYREFSKIKEKIKERYQPQLDSLNGLRDIQLISSIRERLEPYFNELKEKEVNYFGTNTKSYITAYMLQFYTSKLPLDSLKMFYDRMGEEVQISRYGQYFKKKIDEIDNGSPGKKANDFTAGDINGFDITLSQFKGSYVLLDFWASWCIPCRKEHPEMVQLYNKYKDKGIEFIGIADDDGQNNKWREAVKKDNLPWKQILRGLNGGSNIKANHPSQKDINALFGVQSLPTLILIDAKGIIIGRYEENINELRAAFVKIFNNL